MTRQSGPLGPGGGSSDLVFLPVKGSYVAALVVGWLAVALASAAIGARSVAGVGFGASRPQWQITVARSVDTSTSVSTSDAAADIVAGGVAPARAEGRTISVPPYVRPAATGRVASAALPPPASSSPSSTSSVPTASATPSASSGSYPTPNLAITSPPTAEPGKGATKHPPVGKPSPTPLASASPQSWSVTESSTAF